MKKILNKLSTIAFKLSPHLAVRLGLEFPRKSRNRIFLENTIFQYINQCFGTLNPRGACLFIGTDKRAWHYPKKLDLVLHTLDIEKKKAIYGNAQHHIVGSATELGRYYDPESFDVIIANGLIGFGMNLPEQCDQLLEGACALLKADGLLVLGYNDGPDFVNFKVKDSANYTLFAEHEPNIPGLIGSTFEFGNHTYVFLKKHSARHTLSQSG